MIKNKLMTSIKIQKTLHYKMQQRIISDGYGMRGKSKWMIEAIQKFLALPDFPSLVDIAEGMDNLDEIITLRLPEEVISKIDQAVVDVRKEFPAMEGVKSNLIRASIMQRLIREPASVAE